MKAETFVSQIRGIEAARGVQCEGGEEIHSIVSKAEPATTREKPKADRGVLADAKPRHKVFSAQSITDTAIAEIDRTSSQPSLAGLTNENDRLNSQSGRNQDPLGGGEMEIIRV